MTRVCRLASRGAMAPSTRIGRSRKAAKPLQLQGLRTVGLGRFELPTS